MKDLETRKVNASLTNPCAALQDENVYHTRVAIARINILLQQFWHFSVLHFHG